VSVQPFDMVVIGAGPAGEKAATQAAWFGKKVVIVERRPDPGGIAVSDAGIPTKTLRETAAYLTGFRHREVYGVSMALDAELKLERLKRRTGDVKAIMTEAVRGNLARMGVTVLHGASARLLPGRNVRVGDRVLSGEVILLAPGSRPARPGAIPFDDPAVFDSERILELPSLPKSLCVVGGGAVGCEYASIFTALGTQVTLIEGSDRLLAFADAEIAALYADVFRKQGTDVRLSTLVESIARTAGTLRVQLSGGAALTPDSVLFAGGRIGNTEELGLADAGVEVDARGRIKVDEHYRTTAAGIYAAGDVIGPPALASVSQEQGRVAACHAFGIPFKDVVDPLAPFGVYSLPEIAMVGLTEAAAKKQGLDVETGRGHFARNTRARIAGTTEGLVKLVFRRSDRVLVGVHILGDIASELIHLGQLAISRALPIDTFIHSTFNTPTFTEAYKYAAYDGLQRLEGRAPGGGTSGTSGGVTGPGSR
jgi:NAD(P) transhydrogenase